MTIPDIQYPTDEPEALAELVTEESYVGFDDMDDNGNFAGPVLLDLGNDGIDIVPLGQSRARFDIDGDGRRQIMAWVGPDDGLLVYDRDGDLVISHKDEIAFADYLATAETDLEGLAWFDMAAQGGNEDGVLNALDALWSRFGVWRDVDQDGETDPGELTMTGEGGLTSVNLRSDQIRREAGPDAEIYGRGSYQTTDADGRLRSGDLYDAALRYEEDTPRQNTDAAASPMQDAEPGEWKIGDYYPLPLNSTLRDAVRHYAWKHRNQEPT